MKRPFGLLAVFSVPLVALACQIGSLPIFSVQVATETETPSVLLHPNLADVSSTCGGNPNVTRNIRVDQRRLDLGGGFTMTAIPEGGLHVSYPEAGAIHQADLKIGTNDSRVTFEMGGTHVSVTDNGKSDNNTEEGQVMISCPANPENSH